MENCIEWKQGRSRAGYGVKRIGNKNIYAHRLAYCEDRCLTLSAIRDHVIMHTCDNPKCVNPNHLRLGTHADNMADKAARGRAPRGGKHWKAKLSAADVLAIRNTYSREKRNSKHLAQQYGVNRYTIINIAKRKIWSWL